VTNLLRDDPASALVEFALMTPILVLLLLGILDVGRVMNAYVTLSSAAREGSHAAALHPTAAPSALASAVRSRVQPLDPSVLTVEASYWDGTAFVAWPSTGIPASSPGPSHVPTRVSVGYPWEAVASVVGRLVSGTTLSASSTMDTMR
jgi:Flp pilus assembly protein TadG